MSYFPPEALDLTERLCAESPRYAAIRTTLLALEADGDRAGWDTPTSAPTLFAVEHHLLTGRVQARRPAALNTVLRLGLDAADGEPGAVLAQMADAFDYTHTTLGSPPLPATDGYEFYGYAFRAEAWTTGANPDEDARRAVARRELHLHPGRIEARQVYLAGRDGTAWWVMRHRGQHPEVAALLPENTTAAQAGRIPHALARMTNALAGSHAPVPPLVESIDVDDR